MTPSSLVPNEARFVSRMKREREIFRKVRNVTNSSIVPNEACSVNRMKKRERERDLAQLEK